MGLFRGLASIFRVWYKVEPPAIDPRASGDGGSVSSVNGVFPNIAGNITLSPENIGAVGIDDISTVGITGYFSDLLGIPSTFTPSAHTHSISEVLGLDAALNDKLQFDQNLGDVSSPSTAFSNIKQSATTSSSGVAEIAEQTEVDAGVSANTFVTPATLALWPRSVPSGGTMGQVLSKVSGTDYDVEWTDQTGTAVDLDDVLTVGNTTGGQDIVFTSLSGSIYRNAANTFGVTVRTDLLSGNKTQILQDASGYIALLSDIDYKIGQLADIAFDGSASNLVSGLVPSARLGSGVANGDSWLRGDGVWGTVPASALGDVLSRGNTVYTGQLIQFQEDAAAQYEDGSYAEFSAGAEARFQSADLNGSANIVGPDIAASAFTSKLPARNGTVAHLDQIPATLPPNGSAGGDLGGTYPNPTVLRINGVAFSGLGTGILKNTTGTGVPSIAVAGDFPTLNQNTTGSAATLTTNRTFITNLASTSAVNFNGSANNSHGVTGILAGTNGGTNNGFFQVTGPTSSLKTYTFPNANATMVYAGGPGGTPSSLTLTNGTGLPLSGLTQSSATTGQVIAWNGSNWAASTPAADPVTRAKTSSNFTTTSTSMTTVTGATVAVAANTTYTVTVVSEWTSNNNAGAITASLNTPAGATVTGYRWSTIAAQTVNQGGFKVDDGGSVTSGIGTANTTCYVQITAKVIVAGTAGNVNFRVASNNASYTLTIPAGAMIKAEPF